MAHMVHYMQDGKENGYETRTIGSMESFPTCALYFLGSSGGKCFMCAI